MFLVGTGAQNLSPPSGRAIRDGLARSLRLHIPFSPQKWTMSKIETYRALSAEKRGEHMNKRDIQMIARQASGEYMMKHIAGIMGIVQDKRLRNKNEALDEETLVIIEAQVKAIAEGLVHSNGEMKGHDR